MDALAHLAALAADLEHSSRYEAQDESIAPLGSPGVGAKSL